MLEGKTIAVVVPAYNEETQIGMVIETMPEFVDRIVIVNDKSKDATADRVKTYIEEGNYNHSELEVEDRTTKEFADNRYNYADKVIYENNIKEKAYFTPAKIVNQKPAKDRIILINHLQNGGVGAAISSGYKWCKDHNIDCTVVMAGDGQMDPAELKSICEPVIKENVDYVKGNRLIHQSASFVMPRVRFFGNSILSILTKLASGYWRISDTQTGYTAISKKALNAIKIFDIYKSYGMPNDILVKLNIAYCTIREVEIKPVYNVGEQSKMKVMKVIPRVSWLLIKSFFKRVWTKYLLRDFHPLFLLYHFGLLLFLASLPYGFRILYRELTKVAEISDATILAFMFLFISGLNAFFFGMWMDVQDNERLYK